MTSKRDIILAREKREKKFEPVHPVPWGTIKNVNGSTTPTDRPGLVWVDMYNRSQGVIAVRNNTTIKTAGTPVQLGPDPKPPFLQVIGTYNDAGTPQDDIKRYGVVEHGANHQIPTEATPGPDPIKIYQPAIQPLKVTGNGSDLTVTIQPLIYLVNGTRKNFQGDTVDLTSNVPSTAGQSRQVLVYLDKGTGTIETTNGTAVSGATPTPYPTVLNGSIPAGYVKLTNGQTAVTTATHITDTRPIFNTGMEQTSGNIVTDQYGDIVTANGEVVTV